MSLKIALLSDLHLEFKGYLPESADADVLVVAGDVLPIGQGNAVAWLAKVTKKAKKPVLFVPGNHDYYGGSVPEAHAAWKKAAKGTHVQVLVNEAVDIQGVRFLGTPLFSDLSLPSRWPRDLLAHRVERLISDFMAMRRGPGVHDLWRSKDMMDACEGARAFLDAQLPALESSGPAPVVITHWAPSIQSCSPQYLGDDLNPYFLVPCEDLVARAQVWLHGHVHNPCDYRIGARDDRGQVWCNPRGYIYKNGAQERPGIYAPLILEVE